MSCLADKESASHGYDTLDVTQMLGNTNTRLSWHYENSGLNLETHDVGFKKNVSGRKSSKLKSPAGTRRFDRQLHCHIGLS